MRPNGYRLIYDVVRDGRPAAHLWWLALFGAFALVLCVYLNFSPKTTRNRRYRLAVCVWTVLALGFSWYPLWSIRHQYHRFVRAVQEGGASVVEGTVNDFSQPTYRKLPYEHFRVGDVHFLYTDRIDNGGFHHTMAAGGPIRPGLPVRISHFEGTILRLEVRQ